MAIYSKFIDENETSFQHLERANNQCEWMWKIYINFTLFVFFNTIIVAVISALFTWMWTNEFDVKLFYRPFQLRLTLFPLKFGV